MIDWNLVRQFVVVANEGSISKAATVLKTSQPTLGRQIAKLEDAIGSPLMTRGPRGIQLTERGLELLEQGRQIANQMDEFERLVLGGRKEIRGTVRIAATEIVGVKILPPMLRELIEKYPELNVELVLDNRSANLIRGEADIALRLFQPEHADLIGRRVGFLPTGLYASPTYLARHGLPTIDNWIDHQWIGFDSKGPMATYLLDFDPRLKTEHFKFRTDSLTTHLELCLQGVGIAGLQCQIAEPLGLVRVVEFLEFPELPVWLVSHKDVRRGAHVRATVAFLGDALRDYIDAI